MIDVASVAFAIACGFFTIGLIGCFMPVLPGPLIAWLGVFFHHAIMGIRSVDTDFVFLALLATLSVQILEILLLLGGGQRFRPFGTGVIGGLLGAVLGTLLAGAPGLVVAAVAGAIAFELFDRRRPGTIEGIRFARFVAGLAAFAFKLGCTVGAITAFFVALPA